MHIVDKNYIALFDHGIKMLVTYQLYILDPRFVPRLRKDSFAHEAVGMPILRKTDHFSHYFGKKQNHFV